MRPLYAARVEDLGPADLVNVECVCRHSETLTARMLKTAGLEPYERNLDLQFKLRCRECGRKGKVVISIKWGG